MWWATWKLLDTWTWIEVLKLVGRWQLLGLVLLLLEIAVLCQGWLHGFLHELTELGLKILVEIVLVVEYIVEGNRLARLK